MTRPLDDADAYVLFVPAERWADIEGYEGFYQISDHGRVRSLSRTVTRSDGRTMTLPAAILRQQTCHKGYRKVSLCKDSRSRTFRVHVLVLAAFVGPRPAGFDGCHNNGDPADNRLDNLRWDTKVENSRDRVKHGRDPNAIKTHCVRGHEFSRANTRVTKEGHRVCRACFREVHGPAWREKARK